MQIEHLLSDPKERRSIFVGFLVVSLGVFLGIRSQIIIKTSQKKETRIAQAIINSTPAPTAIPTATPTLTPAPYIHPTSIPPTPLAVILSPTPTPLPTDAPLYIQLAHAKPKSFTRQMYRQKIVRIQSQKKTAGEKR
ncbi:hypothetical protein A3D77_06705 [Candidatus Gottesmanbacteria bacterium RIFCSPHIGHO2_02_FULL_39_11]|uniref:Uncharacterized protein n=1 Tax=Candidatus Gottesmanbacteria bacterium RIFCSPHIGHO2_02_FULL_39_11 TaxID=1798382 RepID=A0A1F5ZST6_9BACT|nr:MAG: hypothetical protein A3D77_06705 [Candidatus Gottesmanbacteria bacterium RIFCSPHIGHO2_02_FULL_39_11]